MFWVQSYAAVGIAWGFFGLGYHAGRGMVRNGVGWLYWMWFTVASTVLWPGAVIVAIRYGGLGRRR